jgi:hypothetical protein
VRRPEARGTPTHAINQREPNLSGLSDSARQRLILLAKPVIVAASRQMVYPVPMLFPFLLSLVDVVPAGSTFLTKNAGPRRSPSNGSMAIRPRCMWLNGSAR